MKIKKISLDSLRKDEFFLLSFPSRPDRFGEWMRKFPQLPPIIINERNSIVFGFDGVDYLCSNHVREIQVLQERFFDKDALFLNYNLKEKFFGCNLYEKLVFLKKIKPLTDIREIQEKADLGFPVNREILQKLEQLTSAEFRDLLISDRISLKTALKIGDFQEKDRLPIIRLLHQNHLSISNQYRLLDMVREILFRDKISSGQLFAKINLLEPASNEKSEAKIIDKILPYRYPAYQNAEKKWRNEVKKLKLPADYRLNHADFFEKQKIQLTIPLKNFESLKNLIEKLKK
jgi:hypothetical protein